MKFLLATVYTAALVAAGGVTFSRTVSAINKAAGTVTFDSGCTSKDAYGSNDCTFTWGETVGISYNVALQEDITGGTLKLTSKVDNILPFDANCPACGANCTITIPVVKKSISFALPPCPIKAGSFKNTTSVVLPAKDPAGIGASIKGTLTVTDQNNVEVISVDLTAKITA